MRSYVSKVFLFILVTAFFFSCEDDHAQIKKEANLPEAPSDVKWWLLVRPDNSNIGTTGVYLYNETDSTVEYILDLPANLISPHAIGYDGESLWVGGAGSGSSIYELDPADGAVKSEIENISTEGIACDNDVLWHSSGAIIYKLTYNGTKLDSFSVTSNVIQDIGVNNDKLFYIVNDGNDPIIEIDQNSRKEHTVLLTEVMALYAFAIADNYFVVIDDFNNIKRFDIDTKKLAFIHPTNIEGWITAIAPYKKN